MAKPKSIKLPKLESLEKLEVLLEILNEQSDRYVPYGEIEKEFMKRVNSKKRFDEVDLRNKLVNVLSYAEGLRDDLPPTNEKGLPDQYVPHTASYLADIAQIRQTKLIDRMRLPLKVEGKTKEQDCYMITIRGIEVLNLLRNSRYSKGLLVSSRRLEILARVTGILTIFLIVMTILSISSNSVLIFLVGKNPSFIYFIYLLFFILIGAEILVLLPNLPEWFEEKIINWRIKRRRSNG